MRAPIWRAGCVCVGYNKRPPPQCTLLHSRDAALRIAPFARLRSGGLERRTNPCPLDAGFVYAGAVAASPNRASVNSQIPRGNSMSFRVKPMVQGLALAFGGLAVVGTTAYAQTPPAQTQQQQLERITITGSNIRRTDQETIAPVEIITRESIERSGSQTVAEVLAKLPITSSGVFNETANSFAPGTTSVSLRGLGQDATLVLLNGRRVAGYGFAQNIQDTFVDLSAIPTSAIERIEILKDGASAIYGSDAIAGVVNIILRRDYKGIEVAANAGFYQGKNDYRASVVGGFGVSGSQKFNVFGVLDYYKRDGLTMADTDFGETRDFRGEQGGRNFRRQMEARGREAPQAPPIQMHAAPTS